MQNQRTTLSSWLVNHILLYVFDEEATEYSDDSESNLELILGNGSGTTISPNILRLKKEAAYVRSRLVKLFADSEMGEIPLLEFPEILLERLRTQATISGYKFISAGENLDEELIGFIKTKLFLNKVIK